MAFVSVFSSSAFSALFLVEEAMMLLVIMINSPFQAAIVPPFLPEARVVSTEGSPLELSDQISLLRAHNLVYTAAIVKTPTGIAFLSTIKRQSAARLNRYSQRDVTCSPRSVTTGNGGQFPEC